MPQESPDIVNPNTTDPKWSHFRDVIYSGDFSQAEIILRADPALLHMMNSIGETVLHFLAIEDDQDGVAWLHARGADIDNKNAFGEPLIFEVGSVGHKEMFL